MESEEPWIRAILGNRSQTVVLDDKESGSVPVTSGVSQGSVLGPILFFLSVLSMFLTVGGSEDGKVLQTDLDRYQ